MLQTLFRPWVVGLEHVPDEGAAILASNHLSFSDSLFLPLVLSRRLTFVAKAEYFNSPGLKGAATAKFFTTVGQVPVDRSGGNASSGALEAGLRILKRGDLFGIYPEGTRSPDGRLHRGKTGVARLALAAGVPVIPVAMIDTDRVQPIGRKLPNIHRVGVVFGKPLDFSRYEGMESDPLVLRAITDEIMYELMQLSGQEYVDEYAATVKQRAAALLRTAATEVENITAEVQERARDFGELTRTRTAELAARLRETRHNDATDDGPSPSQEESSSQRQPSDKSLSDEKLSTDKPVSSTALNTDPTDTSVQTE